MEINLILMVMCGVSFVFVALLIMACFLANVDVKRHRREKRILSEKVTFLGNENIDLRTTIDQLKADLKKPRNEHLIDVLADMRKNGVLIEFQIIDRDNVFYHARQD